MHRSKAFCGVVIALVGILCVCTAAQAAGGSVTVTLGSATGSPGDKNKVVPISVSNVTGLGVIAADITLTFDPAVLSLNSLSTADTIAKTWSSPVYNSATPGQAVIALFGTQAISGEGVLLKASFNVKDNARPGTSNISLSKMKLNGGNVVISSIKNGTFTVVGVKRK